MAVFYMNDNKYRMNIAYFKRQRPNSLLIINIDF